MNDEWDYVFRIALPIDLFCTEFFVSAKELQDAFEILMKHLVTNEMHYLYGEDYEGLEFPDDYLSIENKYFKSYMINIETEIFERAKL